MSGNGIGGRIIDPKADAAVQQAMASMQQQVQLAIMVVELRDRFALAALPMAMARVSPTGPTAAVVRECYEIADLMLRIRMEKPSEAPVPAQP